MNIRLFRICAVPIRISSPDFHVPGTCLFMNGTALGGTWLLRAIHVDHSCYYILVGVRVVHVPIFVHTIKIQDKVISLKVLEVSLMLAQFLIPA